MSLADQPPRGQLLHGVEHCYIIANETNHKPNVIMLIGEAHGGQTCGDSDYVSAYKTFLQYNEANTKIPIDILIEVTNLNVILNRKETMWMQTMRNAFQDCYVFNNRDDGKCVFRHARFHWSDPIWDIPEWISDLHHIPYQELLQVSPNARKGMDKYKRILQEITSEDDLQKIIFQNPHIINQGERCNIVGWRGFIREQYNKLYRQWKEEFCNEWKSNPENYWWEYGMFDTRRFAMDVYAFLRMFRKKEQQHRRWTAANRFENIIYHAGTFHINNMKQLLLSLSNENMNFNVVKETHADDTVNSCNACCRVDFMEFLKICQDKKSMRSKIYGFFKKKTATNSSSKGSPKGSSKGSPKGSSKGSPKGSSKGSPKGSSKGSPKGSPKSPNIPTMTLKSFLSPGRRSATSGGSNSKTRTRRMKPKIK